MPLESIFIDKEGEAKTIDQCTKEELIIIVKELTDRDAVARGMFLDHIYLENKKLKEENDKLWRALGGLHK